MPNYPNAIGTATIPTTALQTIWPNDTVLAFDAETPTAPQASQRFAVANAGPYSAATLSVELLFAADPGVFSVTIQDADTDADIYYQTLASSGTISSVSSYFTARVELVPFKGKFVRLVIASRTNAVALTARITR